MMIYSNYFVRSSILFPSCARLVWLQLCVLLSAITCYLFLKQCNLKCNYNFKIVNKTQTNQQNKIKYTYHSMTQNISLSIFGISQKW
jgi:hypothetical protein